MLDNISSNIEDEYDRTLQRIMDNDKQLESQEKVGMGMKLIQWVFFALRPLTFREIQYALAIRPRVKDLDVKRSLLPSSVIDLTLGLITIDAHWQGETLRLVHTSLRDHLLQKSSIYFPSGHTLLAEVTLTYLSLDAMSNSHGRFIYGGDLEPFFYYAAKNWGHHVREQEDKGVLQLALNLLQGACFSNLMAVRKRTHCFLLDGFNEDHTVLHEVAFFGLTSVLSNILRHC